MKKKEKMFKFDLGQHVFLLGKAGRCIVTGRGTMEFSSGGTRPMYQVIGGHFTIVQEDVLISVAEARALGGFV